MEIETNVIKVGNSFYVLVPALVADHLKLDEMTFKNVVEAKVNEEGDFVIIIRKNAGDKK